MSHDRPTLRSLRAAQRCALALACAALAGSGCDRVKEAGTRNARAVDASTEAGSDAGAQPSLCTPERDPSGILCTPGRIGSLRAFELARAELPHARLITLRSDPSGTLGPDGLDTNWSLWLEDESTSEVITASVSDTDVSTERHPEAKPCGAAAEIEVLDSERVVPQAVRDVEEHAGLFVGNLLFQQSGCDNSRPEAHTVALGYRGDDAMPEQWYFARYWDDGRFIELVGPCSDSIFESCLAGVP